MKNAIRIGTGLLILCLTDTGFAQNALYFTNGNRIAGAQLVELTDEKIKFAVKRGETMVNYSYRRENVLMAFNQDGHFLVTSDLNADPTQAQQQFRSFLMAQPRPIQTDLLVKAVPLTVIPATISYESDEVVNYQLPGGGAGSISKADLVGIVYRNGRHQILRDPGEAAPLLATVRQQLATGTGSVPDPTPQPAPAPAVAPVAAAVIAPAPIAPAVTESAPAPVAPAAVAPVPVTPAPQPMIAQTSLTSTPTTTPAPVAVDKPKLTDEEYQTYRTKALRKVDEFASYLNVITDKKLTGDEKDKAIEQAAKLFMPSATIEVTSASRPGSRRYPIRDYLTRLKLLPYSSAKVEWSEIQYIRELTQAADGNYYGTITGQQTFTGYGQGDNVLYSDVTQKNVRVKLQSYQKLIDGQGQVNWEVLLGNIGVANN